MISLFSVFFCFSHPLFSFSRIFFLRSNHKRACEFSPFSLSTFLCPSLCYSLSSSLSIFRGSQHIFLRIKIRSTFFLALFFVSIFFLVLCVYVHIYIYINISFSILSVYHPLKYKYKYICMYIYICKHSYVFYITSMAHRV